MFKQITRVKKSQDANSWVIFGKTIRSDKDAEFQLILKKEGGDFERVMRELIGDRNKICLGDLTENGEYFAAVFGAKIAGVATTQDVELKPPFRLHIDAPQDHSKDFMKLSIPTNVPVGPDLARAIKASLR